MKHDTDRSNPTIAAALCLALASLCLPVGAARGATDGSGEAISNTPSRPTPAPPSAPQKKRARATPPSENRGGGRNSRGGGFTVSDFVGEWRLHDTCDYASGDETFRVALGADGQLSFSGGAWNASITGGSFDHGAIRLTSGNFLNSIEYTGALTSPKTMSGTYVQSISPGANCRFTGTK